MADASSASGASPAPQVIDKLVSFDTAPGGDLITKHSQYIPDEFLTDLRHEKEDSLHTPAGEFHRVASIPVVVVDELSRRGIDIYRDSIQDILKMLRKIEAEIFITTKKAI